MHEGDTIVALSSGAVPSGVAVIRLSGPLTAELVRQVAGPLPAPRRLVLRTLRGETGPLDSGLIAWFPEPRSFTGEDCAELQVHGSPAGVRAILRHLTGPGRARLAAAGEFTRRAFENGKLDLPEVEGLGDLLQAETEAQRRQALARLDGVLSRQLDRWREQLLDARAELEAQLDFSDEGDVGKLPADYGDSLLVLAAELRTAAEQTQQGRIVREGVRVALAGPPNAGKSSLLNALARSDVAIVTDEPGTTRDVREVAVDLGGQLVVLIDMAGLGDAASKAEAEGVRRARAELARADLVLWLLAPDVTELEPPASGTVWQVRTKADLGVPAGGPEMAISSQTGDGIDMLLERLTRFAATATGGGEPPVVSRERDRLALAAAGAEVEAARGELTRPELAAEALRRASAALERLLGRIDSEAVLDRLFSGFCIGK